MAVNLDIDDDRGVLRLSLKLNSPRNDQWLPAQAQMAPVPPPFPHNNIGLPAQAQMAPAHHPPLFCHLDYDDDRYTLKIHPVSADMIPCDWRKQFPADSRQETVSKITETLKRHAPFCEQEELEEIKKIAIRFEEKMYTAAITEFDYETRIYLKMLNFQHKENSFEGNADSYIQSLAVHLDSDEQ